MLDRFHASLEKFDKYIWHVAHKFSKSIPAYDPADLHQEGVISLYEVYQAHGCKPDEAVHKLFKTYLVNRFIDIYRKEKKNSQTLVLDLEMASAEITEDAFNDLFLQHYREHLQYFVSQDAGRLLGQLLDPDPALIRMHNVHIARKAHLKALGHPVCAMTKRIPKKILSKYLGFSCSKTAELMLELQTAWRNLQCHPFRCSQSAATS